MSFDVNDPADLAALKTELTTDPVGVGYDLSGSMKRATFLVNDPDSNSGGETVAREFTAESMLDALNPTDHVQ